MESDNTTVSHIAGHPDQCDACKGTFLQHVFNEPQPDEPRAPRGQREAKCLLTDYPIPDLGEVLNPHAVNVSLTLAPHRPIVFYRYIT